MLPLAALAYSFLFGLLHGILPDEHTWPITFSYAMGGASGKQGMKASLYFSLAFTVQRMMISEVAYLALAPFLLSPTINGIVYLIVGMVMSAAGALLLRKNAYPHLHVLGHHHEAAKEIEMTGHVLARQHADFVEAETAPPARWTLVHGFIAGFGFGGFSLFVNTVAAPAMPNAWLGFLPGLLFGLGTMITLILIGALFGTSLRLIHSLTEQEIKRVGALTGGRTLFFGGLLFAAAGIVTLMGLDRAIPLDVGTVVIGAFMIVVAVPAFVFSLRGVLGARQFSSEGT